MNSLFHEFFSAYYSKSRGLVNVCPEWRFLPTFCSENPIFHFSHDISNDWNYILVFLRRSVTAKLKRWLLHPTNPTFNASATELFKAQLSPMIATKLDADFPNTDRVKFKKLICSLVSAFLSTSKVENPNKTNLYFVSLLTAKDENV